ncbi:MAG: twin-arginine translocase subunit TatC [SAR202 cluster bacterium]|nr:twin-arginine translocase subunit TatC [SAR202 cluster bacterium]
MSEVMTLRDHLEELRKRLLLIVIFVVIAMITAFIFRDGILNFLLEPGFSQLDEKPIATEVLETVSVTFKVTLMVAFVVSTPMLLYQLIMFASPGLTVREKVYLFLFLPAVIIAFVTGMAFAYYVLFPPAFNFLFNFGSENINAEIRISSYINVLLSLMFWMGIIFQIPLILFGLARLGVVTPRVLGRFRRFAILLAFVAAAIITPTFDPVNQTLVAVPIVVLYEFGIVLARLGQFLRKRSSRDREQKGILRTVCTKLKFW